MRFEQKPIQPHLARGKRVKCGGTAPMAIILCAFDRARAVDAPTYSVYSQTPSRCRVRALNGRGMRFSLCNPEGHSVTHQYDSLS